MGQRCQELDMQVGCSVSSALLFTAFTACSGPQLHSQTHTHTHSCMHTHTFLWYSINRSGVIGRDAWTLLSGAAVAERLWAHSASAVVATRQRCATERGPPHPALGRQRLARVTDLPSSLTSRQIGLACSPLSLAAR